MGNLPIKLETPLGFTWMIIGILMCFFSLPPRLVQGLKCYECGKGEKGDYTCWRYISNPSPYEKECAPNATACLQYRVQRDYVLSSGNWDMSRTCVYPGDMKCLIGTDAVSPDSEHITYLRFQYKTAMDCLRESRSKLGLPPPYSTESLVANHQNTILWYRFTEGDLSNNRPNYYSERTPYTNSPSDSDHFCYSCEATEVSTKFNYEEEDHEDHGLKLIPSCNGKEKQIYCWDAAGCAAFWETRKGAGGELTTRVWRGCWNSGDQRCLRSPTILEDKDVDDKDDYNKGDDEDEKKKNSDECDKLMKNGRARSVSSVDKTGQSYEVKGLGWSGLKTIPNFASYNEYLKCRDDNEHIGENKWLNYHAKNKQLKQLTKEERPPTDDKKNFARIRYHFCKGSSSETRCNIWKGMSEADVPELPPIPPFPTTTTTPTPSLTTASPELGPRGEKLDGCYPTGKNAGSSLLNFSFSSHWISITTFLSVLSLRLSFM